MSGCTPQWRAPDQSPLELDLVDHRLRAELREPRGIGLVERVAVGVGRRDVEAAGQQRLVIDAEAVVAVDRRPAEMGAVVAPFERQKLGAGRRALDAVILPREAQRRFHRVRAAGGEKGAGHAVGGEHAAQLVAELDRGLVGGACEGGIVGQRLGLGRDGVLDRLARIANIYAPQPGDAVDDSVAGHVGNSRAIRAGDDARGRLLLRAGVAHGVPHVAGVIFVEKV